jgi:hypothetical protein
MYGRWGYILWDRLGPSMQVDIHGQVGIHSLGDVRSEHAWCISMHRGYPWALSIGQVGLHYTCTIIILTF